MPTALDRPIDFLKVKECVCVREREIVCACESGKESDKYIPFVGNWAAIVFPFVFIRKGQNKYKWLLMHFSYCTYTLPTTCLKRLTRSPNMKTPT